MVSSFEVFEGQRTPSKAFNSVFAKGLQNGKKDGEQQLRSLHWVFILATPGQGMFPADTTFGKKDHVILGS